MRDTYTTMPDNWPMPARIADELRRAGQREPSLHVGPTPPRDYPPVPRSAPRRISPSLHDVRMHDRDGTSRARGVINSANTRHALRSEPVIATVLAADVPMRIKDLPKDVIGHLVPHQVRYRLNQAVADGILQRRETYGREGLFFDAGRQWPGEERP